MLIRQLLLAASLLWPAAALADPMACAEHNALRSTLAGGKMREAPAVLASDILGHPVVIFVGPGGSWTMAVIIAGPDGRRLACIVSMGDGWSPAPPPPVGKPS